MSYFVFFIWRLHLLFFMHTRVQDVSWRLHPSASVEKSVSFGFILHGPQRGRTLWALRTQPLRDAASKYRQQLCICTVCTTIYDCIQYSWPLTISEAKSSGWTLGGWLQTVSPAASRSVQGTKLNKNKKYTLHIYFLKMFSVKSHWWFSLWEVRVQYWLSCFSGFHFSNFNFTAVLQIEKSH